MTPTLSQGQAEPTDAELLKKCGFDLANEFDRPSGSCSCNSCVAYYEALDLAASSAAPTADLRAALSLGLHHARWSRDRSSDAHERKLNERDVATIARALNAAAQLAAAPVIDQRQGIGLPNGGCPAGDNYSVDGACAQGPAQLAAVAAPPADDDLPTDPLEAIIDRYIEGYEFNDGESTHRPSETERFVMKDAFMGLLADDEWDAEWGKHIRSLAAVAAPDARMPLTDEQLDAVANEHFDNTEHGVKFNHRTFARALLAQQAAPESGLSQQELLAALKTAHSALEARCAFGIADEIGAAIARLQPPLTEASLRIGGRYNWKNQSERLVYVGMCEPRNGRWHQFEKVGEPGAVWCEVLAADLHLLEPTAQQAGSTQ